MNRLHTDKTTAYQCHIRLIHNINTNVPKKASNPDAKNTPCTVCFHKFWPDSDVFSM